MAEVVELSSTLNIHTTQYVIPSWCGSAQEQVLSKYRETWTTFLDPSISPGPASANVMI